MQLKIRESLLQNMHCVYLRNSSCTSLQAVMVPLACVLFAEHADAVLMIYFTTTATIPGTVEQCADICPQVQDTTSCHAPM